MYQQRAEVLTIDRAYSLGVTIVMPCLNETISLPHCIANARHALDQIKENFGLEGEIVIADNGSTDGSQALAESLGARVVAIARRGYGAALIGGCEAAFGDYILMGDCDGSYNFTEGVAMIGKLIEKHDLCMGSRFDGGIAPGAMPWKNRHIGNPLLTGILNLFFRSGINDAHCGLRAISRDAFSQLGLAGEGMEFASEMVIKASLKKMKVAQVPATLSVDLRDRAPHLRPWRDGWRHLRYLLMLSPTWVFGVPAMLAMGSGALILLIALAHLIGVAGGEPLIGASWTIAAGFLVSVGHLAAIMALATHFHGVNRGYRTLRPLIRRYADYLTLETMLIAGVLLLLGSTVGVAVVIYYWSQTGFAALATVLPTVVALTGATVAIQTILGGFLLAIINGHRAALTPDGAER
ncbi:family 2 glycosyl transferase [Sphingopyxis bauzanensis]|uniref:Family 2 glycosyl transferase n=1 Tax=Sphingopyxis bauzanensis TaxID=651663 RepID=A0A246K085_9SPHN|nr:family 2 glycosyl transferase [Sphingopyxis bauzanensis]GGJ58057.1 dolichol-P-glucose synthetase [Sphingopyxis bauzanensis]